MEHDPFYSVAMNASTGTTIRGRLAPSPTGLLHLGNAYAFLTAWLDVRSQSGTLVLRMEDIDPERSREAFSAQIMEDLHWLGLGWDEGPEDTAPYGPYRQSLCFARYERLMESLAHKGLLYPCFCTRKELRSLASAPHIGDEGVPYPGTCALLSAQERQRKEKSGKRFSLRLHVDKALELLARESSTPEAFFAQNLNFQDALRGAFDFACGPGRHDFALRRSDGVFAYQLAVAADDAAMHITEVVRGEDLLASTPRQLLLFALMGAKAPRYAHIPLLCDTAGERLAKRHKSLELGSLRAKGVPPDAITGFLAFMAGWLPKPEPASPADILPLFSLKALQGKELKLPHTLPF